MRTPNTVRRIVMWLERTCCFHDYLLRYDAETKRQFLECRKCLRTTPGWAGVQA